MLYGQPSGRALGRAGSGRNDDRRSPISTTPSSSRAASLAPSSVCSHSTSAASWPFTRWSSASCACRWSRLSFWSDQVWIGRTNTAAAMATMTASAPIPAPIASRGRRRIRFSTGIGRLRSPRRDEPSSAAADGVGRLIEVVPERVIPTILARVRENRAASRRTCSLAAGESSVVVAFSVPIPRARSGFRTENGADVATRRRVRSNAAVRARMRRGIRPPHRGAPRCAAAGCTWRPDRCAPAHRS